jgi:hypothetical protein
MLKETTADAFPLLSSAFVDALAQQIKIKMRVKFQRFWMIIFVMSTLTELHTRSSFNDPSKLILFAFKLFNSQIT